MFKIFKEDKFRSLQNEDECKVEFLDSFATKTKATICLEEKYESERRCQSNRQFSRADDEFSFEYSDWSDKLLHRIRYYVKECKTVQNGENIVDVSSLDYDYIDDFQFNRAIVKKDGEWGIIDDKLKPILSCNKYSSIAPYKEYSFSNYEPVAKITIKKGEGLIYGAIDLSGNFVVRAANGDYYKIPSKNIFWAYSGSETRWVRVQVYSHTIEPFSYPYTEYEECSFYDIERHVFMKFGDYPTLGDTFGLQGYALAIGGMEGDVARFTYDGKVGIIDSDEHILVEPKYKQILPYSDGLAAIRTPTEMKTEFMPDGKHYRRVPVKLSKWGFINKKGQEVILPQYNMVHPFSAGHAAFNIGGRVQSIQTVEVTHEEIPDSIPYEDTHVLVFQGGKWGFLNTEGEQVIAPEYDSCSEFFNGRVAIIGKGNKLGLITSDLKYQTCLEYDRIEYDRYKKFIGPAFTCSKKEIDEDGYRILHDWTVYEGANGFIVEEYGINYLEPEPGPGLGFVPDYL